MRLAIETKSTGRVLVELTEECPKTLEALLEALPFASKANIWGDEVYFSTPVEAAPENPVEVVEEGAVAYWPPGRALCIFYGPTPASRGDEIRPASPVNPLGRVVGDPRIFSRVRGSEEISVSLAP